MGSKGQAIQAVLDLNDDDFEDAVLALLDAASQRHRTLFLFALRQKEAA